MLSFEVEALKIFAVFTKIGCLVGVQPYHFDMEKQKLSVTTSLQFKIQNMLVRLFSLAGIILLPYATHVTLELHKNNMVSSSCSFFMVWLTFCTFPLFIIPLFCLDSEDELEICRAINGMKSLLNWIDGKFYFQFLFN